MTFPNPLHLHLQQRGCLAQQALGTGGGKGRALDSPRGVKDPSQWQPRDGDRCVPWGNNFSSVLLPADQGSHRRGPHSHASTGHFPAQPRRDLGPTSSTCLLQLHPKICLPGAVTALEGEGTCQNSPAWGNPSSCSPGRPFLSDVGEQLAPLSAFLSDPQQ